MAQKYSYNEKKGMWSTLVWDGTYTETGAKHRKQICSKKSSADLEKLVKAFKEDVEKRAYARSAHALTSFGHYAEHWLETTKATRELNTRKMYANVIQKHFGLIYDMPISAIRHSHFQALINEQIDHPRTCQQIALTFKQVMRSAAMDRLIAKADLDDILTGISMPRYKKPQKRPLSALEKEAIRKADLDDRKRAFLDILYYTGMRRGEVLGLMSADFDWTAGTVAVSRVVIFDVNAPQIKPYPKSENGLREIPLPLACQASLKKYTEAHKDGFLFHSSGSALMTKAGYDRMWQSIICSLNVALGYDPQAKKGDAARKQITDLTAHVFRHNYCTELCYQVPKISTKMIAKLLGDTERMVLNVYGHLQEEKEDLYHALNSCF